MNNGDTEKNGDQPGGRCGRRRFGKGEGHGGTEGTEKKDEVMAQSGIALSTRLSWCL